MAEKPNVLFVVMDSVRARNTSLYDYHRETTPFLSEFAETATVYEQARAPAPKSLTSHASMFTGLHVEEHNVTSRERRLRPDTTVWDRLSADGYATGAFSENTFLTELDVGLKSAFDYVYSGTGLPYSDALNPSEYANGTDIEYGRFLIDSIKDKSPIRSFLNGLAKLRGSKDADVYVDEFLDWRNTVSGPWAGVINFMDAHTRYHPPEGHNEWAGSDEVALMDEIGNPVWEFQCEHRPYDELEALEGLYDGCIRYIDAQLSRLFGELEAAGELDDTLVIVTADHGEGFGEESRVRPDTRLAGHGEAKIHEALLHVPLVVKRPRQEDAERIEQPVSLTALAPAIERTVEGGVPRDALVNDEPVLATAVGLQDVGQGQKRALAYCEDLERYTGYSRAVYDTDGDWVRKRMSWKSHAAAIRVDDAQLTTQIDHQSASEAVSDVFEPLSDAGVADDNSGDVDDEVYQRLQELGYA